MFTSRSVAANQSNKCSHTREKRKRCRKCTKWEELPSEGLDYDQDVVGRANFDRLLKPLETVSIPSAFVYCGQEMSVAEYAKTLARFGKTCIDFASTSSLVANLDASLSDVIADVSACLKPKTTEDLSCHIHVFRNNYAHTIKLYSKHVEKAPELGKMPLEDTFCFPRFVCLNIVYYRWRLAIFASEEHNLFKPFETMLDSDLLDCSLAEIEDLMLFDEEFCLLKLIVLFTTGANLSVDSQQHLQKSQKQYIQALTQFNREHCTSDLSETDTLLRIRQLLNFIVSLGDLAEDLSRNLVLATAFNWGQLQTNLAYDMHLRKY